jgi:hypothetical protein
MAQLFVSYPREYRPIVDRLVSDLRKSGYKPYFDRQLAGGQDWWDELMSRIENAAALVPIIGLKYLDSPPCAEEASYAAALGKPFLPIAVEDVSQALFPETIASAQWVKYDPEDPDTVFEVIRAINGLVPPPELPDPMPPRPIVPISYMTKVQSEIGGEAEITHSRQLELIHDLKVRLGTPDKEAAGYLLNRMRQRSDIGHQAKLDIDEALERARQGQDPHEPKRLEAQPAEQGQKEAEEAAAHKQAEGKQREAKRQERARQEQDRHEQERLQAQHAGQAELDKPTPEPSPQSGALVGAGSEAAEPGPQRRYVAGVFDRPLLTDWAFWLTTAGFVFLYVTVSFSAGEEESAGWFLIGLPIVLAVIWLLPVWIVAAIRRWAVRK